MEFDREITVPTGDGFSVDVMLERVDAHTVNLSICTASTVFTVTHLSHVGLRFLAELLSEAADKLEQGQQ